jgi:hypothetical protein
MVLHTALPVYRDIYQLILKVFEYTKDFSKEYKYTVGQDMKLLSIKKQAALSGLMEGIGKQVTGWRNATR